jgi:acetoin utilization protein AcuB
LSTGAALAEDSIWPGSQSTVRENMRDHVITITPDVTVKEAAKLIMDKRITGAPVTKNGKLLGVVSRKDLIRTLAENRETGGALAAKELLALESTPVTEIMTKDPVSISPHDKVENAARLMYQTPASRVMVVDDGLLVGIITASDIIRIGFCDELSEAIYDEDD